MQRYRRPCKFLRAVQRRSTVLHYIIDQMSALDPEPKGEDDVPDDRKFSLGALIQRILASHVLVTSTLENHKSAIMAAKDTGDQKIPFIGRHDDGEGCPVL
jgi:hypothetical protein